MASSSSLFVRRRLETNIIVLCRACMHDPAVYEDPHVFRPERFIRDGKLDPSVRDPLAFVFGFGRRFDLIPWWYVVNSHRFWQDLSRSTLRRSFVTHTHLLDPSCVRRNPGPRRRRPPYRHQARSDTWICLVRTLPFHPGIL